MRRQHFGIFATAAVLATAGIVNMAAGPALAATTCDTSQYPALPGGESGIKTACTVAAPAPSAFTYHDFAPASGTGGGAVWHPGAARNTAADAHVTSGSATVTSATGFFSALVDINRGISGPGIPLGAFIKSVTSATAAVISAAATATTTVGVLKIENSTSRTVANGHTTNASTAVTSATANFQAADVGKLITGSGIKPGTTITARSSVTAITISQAADATSTAATLTFAQPVESSTARALTDAHTTAASKNITSATALFSASDKGITVTGPGIPAQTIITAVTSATAATLNKAATATSAVAKLIIGAPTITAPVNGEQVLQLTAELQLSPSLVKTSDSCAEGTPEGFQIPGKWQNPGSFVTSGVLGTAPSNSIAQILVPTAVVSFAGYIVRVANNHYDVQFPVLPVGLAACANTDIGTAFTFNALTPSQGAAATGRGVPGTNIVRGLRDIGGAPVATSSSVVLGATFTSNCTVDRQINAPSFACGQG